MASGGFTPITITLLRVASNFLRKSLCEITNLALQSFSISETSWASPCQFICTVTPPANAIARITSQQVTSFRIIIATLSSLRTP